MTIHKQKKLPIVENSIFASLGAFSSFAERAAYVGNDKGVVLAVLRLEECYEKSVQSQLDNIARYAITELTKVAAYIVENRSRLSGQSSLGQPIDEYIMNILQKSNFHKAIEQAIREVYMKQWSDHKAIWEFITHLGKQMQTNFGFMFDWQTGHSYAADDPRRQ